MTSQALAVLEGNCLFLCGDEKFFSELLNLSLSFPYLKKNVSEATTDYKNSHQAYWAIQSSPGRADELLLCHCINMCYIVINNMGLEPTTAAMQFIIFMSCKRFPQFVILSAGPELAALCQCKVGCALAGLKMSS